MVENLDDRMETLIQEVRRNNPSNETMQKPGNKGSTSEEMRVDEPALREEMIYLLSIYFHFQSSDCHAAFSTSNA